jgi:hypothetical protein
MFRADFPSTKVNLGTFFVGLAKGLRKKKTAFDQHPRLCKWGRTKK